jgi:hypothetical protein
VGRSARGTPGAGDSDVEEANLDNERPGPSMNAPSSFSRRVVSFCVFGTEPKYIRGMVRNAELAECFYPGWILRVYAAGDSSEALREAGLLRVKGCVELFTIPGEAGNKLWRLRPLFSPETSWVVFRDADSRMNYREWAAGRVWRDSPEQGLAHVMRDHPLHTAPIMAGMWGINARRFREEHPESFEKLREALAAAPRIGQNNSDQQWMAENFWPILEPHFLQHDDFHRERFPGALPFPNLAATPASDRFVGEVFDENDAPRDFDTDWRLRKKVLLGG